MKRIRVIPVLGMENGQLVKTVRFSKPAYIGDPLMAIKIFNDKEVDELMIADIRATKNGAEPNYSLLKDMAGECFMPLGYGGGIRTADQGKRIFDLGIEKIVVGSAFHNNPDLIGELAAGYGAQSIVVCIDVKKNLFGKPRVCYASAGKTAEMTPAEAALKAQNCGAGEIIIHNTDRDGTFQGYDTELIRSVAEAVNIPVVALGGARGVEDFRKAVLEGKASAVAASSHFVYNRNDTRSILINYPSPSVLRKELFDHVQ